MHEWIALLGTGAVSSLAGASIAAIFGRRKIAAEVRKVEADSRATDASTADVIAQTAVALLTPMRIQIEELNLRVASLEQENSELREHIKRLEDS